MHLNTIAPDDLDTQRDSFRAAGISVAALLHHEFVEDRYQLSREWDPIVGVSLTGLFDFFVHAFGVEWLQWWADGRPDTDDGKAFKEKEAEYLNFWREEATKAVWEYCDRHGLKRPNRCTTLQPAGCLDRTALRIFDQGLLYADEIVEAGSGESEGLDLSVRGGIGADKAIANQPLQLIRVTLRNGRILRMTPNHRLSVGGRWVRADALITNMVIDHSLGEYSKTEEALLLGLDPLGYTREERHRASGHGRGLLTKTISTPTAVSPDLGYFLGCFFGNGAMSPSHYRVRFSFNTKDYDLAVRLQGIGNRLFGLEGSIYTDSKNPLKSELTFASKQLFDWLKLNGLGKTSSATLDRIPQPIRKSSKETILAFFCGLIDTDGCVRSEGSLSIDSASEPFIRNLQQVGEAVGLCFSVFHNTKGQNLQGKKNMWGLCLSRMRSTPEALQYLNKNSRKCGLRPLPALKRTFSFHPYQVTSVELETDPDYSYDFAVAGQDDDDSWYWQGALKSHNTKSLLTGASPGWHPPIAQRFIRRITFRREDPIAKACMEWGYNIVPSQSDKDDDGNLLNDPFDPRCTEWLVEIPTEVSWANLPGADQVDLNQFTALAQFDFYMQVQVHYATHNVSATISFREHEIEPLADRIYQAIQDDEGYISAALLARFDALETFPRLPFEPIDRDTYANRLIEVEAARSFNGFRSFAEALEWADRDAAEKAKSQAFEAGPVACDSEVCQLPERLDRGAKID